MTNSEVCCFSSNTQQAKIQKFKQEMWKLVYRTNVENKTKTKDPIGWDKMRLGVSVCEFDMRWKSSSAKTVQLGISGWITALVLLRYSEDAALLTSFFHPPPPWSRGVRRPLSLVFSYLFTHLQRPNSTMQRPSDSSAGKVDFGICCWGEHPRVCIHSVNGHTLDVVTPYHGYIIREHRPLAVTVVSTPLPSVLKPLLLL